MGMTLEYPPIIPTKTPRVAFYGPMASGKTTAAIKLFPEYYRAYLAKPLKDTAREYYGVTGKTNQERQILQELADDLKKWDNDVFTKRLLWDVLTFWYSNENTPVVVDDLRFTHEANDLREHGFVIVRVYVPEDLRLARVKEKYPDTDESRHAHRSEKDWKNIKPDFTISGDGEDGIASLREALKTRATE